MNYNVDKVERTIGFYEINSDEVSMTVTEVKKDFKLFDTFKDNGKLVKVYKNSERMYYFVYARDNNTFNNCNKLSQAVPCSVITNRIRTSKKYTFEYLYKLNTTNPSENYLVSEKTLLQLTKYQYTIIPNPMVAHGYRLYNVKG